MTRHLFFQRALDVGLFTVTLVAIAVSFIEGMPEWTTMAVLVSFVVMFFVRWRLADNRKAWMKSNWFDLVVVVLLSSPILRMLMALRFAHLIPALRLGAVVRANKDRLLRLLVLSGDSLPVAMAMIFGIVFVFGTGAYLLEHDHNPQFAAMQDGLWWAFVTLTTVGYGDIVPITSGGRIVAVVTMMFGIVVYSLVIANVTVFLEEYSRKQKALKKKELKKMIEGSELNKTESNPAESAKVDAAGMSASEKK